jgi:anti-sigma-K factor RskA
MAGAELDGRDDAAEYALGTLDASERAAFEVRVASDPMLAAEVAQWQERLAALHAETEPAGPPAYIFANVLARIGADTNNVVSFDIAALKRRAALWRRVAIAVSAAAATLILFVLVRNPWQAQDKGLYVAVLQGSNQTPAFVAAVDVKSNLIVVRSLGARAPRDRSYELWALGAGRAAPQPLGVIQAVARIPTEELGQTGDNALTDTTLAVSLEPEGGSPTGKPTGPVLFTGKLLSTQ